MTPWEKYQQDLERDDFKFDPAQENAVRELQRLYDDLMLQGMPKSSLASKMKASKTGDDAVGKIPTRS